MSNQDAIESLRLDAAEEIATEKAHHSLRCWEIAMLVEVGDRSPCVAYEEGGMTQFGLTSRYGLVWECGVLYYEYHPIHDKGTKTRATEETDLDTLAWCLRVLPTLKKRVRRRQKSRWNRAMRILRWDD